MIHVMVFYMYNIEYNYILPFSCTRTIFIIPPRDQPYDGQDKCQPYPDKQVTQVMGATSVVDCEFRNETKSKTACKMVVMTSFEAAFSAINS